MSIEDNRENEEKLFAELKGIVDSAMAGPDAEEIYTRFAKFVAELRKQHSGIEDYRLFHPQFDWKKARINEFQSNTFR